MTTKLVDVSNPAAFGVEWTAGENGNTYQLSTPRDTASLHFGVRHEGKTEWMTSTVVDPSRFGLTSPPRSFAEFRRVAEAFIDG